ncbi:MAG: hypothetical protein GY906_04145 [bacterium]|nr:hypothetical protein [bacterium]
MSKIALALFVVVAFLPSTAGAQQEDVQFVLLGKTRNYRQSTNGAHSLLNTVFFGEIFLNEGGKVTNGRVTGPGDARRGLLFGSQEVPFLAGNRHTSIAALEEEYPDGTYYFDFDTPHGSIRGMPVTFSKHGRESRNPAPIEITLHQHGRVANPTAIDPNEDLRVTWNDFEYGAADPNHIIDDMIYVIMGNCFGVKTVHSGHAFASPSLTFDAREFTIPRNSLHAGQPFQVEVEFSEMDTDRQKNITSIVTYATSTFLDIRTTGTNMQDVTCPMQPLAMDGGQTDRLRR